MLHPITWPNHGPQIELYHAEEAIGLVRSLNWEVAKGPLWKDEKEIEEENERNRKLYFDIDDEHKTEGGEQSEHLTTSDGAEVAPRKTFG